MNRRMVLKYGLSGAALFAVGGAGLSLRPGKTVEPAAALRVLSRTEYSVLVAIAERVLPAGDGFPSPTSLQVAERLDALLAVSDPAAAEELKMLLASMDNALISLVVGGPPTPFTRLSPQKQDAVLTDWRDSRLVLKRTAFKALRAACLSTYFSHPDVFALVGYPGPPDFSAMVLEEPLAVPQ